MRGLGRTDVERQALLAVLDDIAAVAMWSHLGDGAHPGGHGIVIA